VTQPPSLVALFVAPLNRAAIEYMVTGGLAAITYGHPRMTNDVDLVVRLAASDTDRFASLWDASAFYCPPVEVIAAELARGDHGHFNVIHADSGMRADVYLSGTDEFRAWALKHRVTRLVEGEPMHVAPIEYVIVLKLWYAAEGGSDRHLRDVKRMLEVSGDTVDQRQLEHWIARTGVTEQLRHAQAFRDPA